MFDLKRPCADCPFRVGMGSLFQLPPERLESIRGAVAFQCHRTVQYDAGVADDEGEDIPQAGDRPEQCAGLMAVLHRMGEPNQIMQVAMRLEKLEPETLDPRGEAYATWEAVRAAHIDGREPEVKGTTK